MNMDAIHKIFRKSPKNNISIAVRDRPFERTVTMHKDSHGHVGFQFNNGKINTIVKDSSAARNGLLIEHQLLEVNGQNVVGMKDKEIHAIINQAEQIVTVTIIPSFIYDHMMKKYVGWLNTHTLCSVRLRPLHSNQFSNIIPDCRRHSSGASWTILCRISNSTTSERANLLYSSLFRTKSSIVKITACLHFVMSINQFNVFAIKS